MTIGENHESSFFIARQADKNNAEGISEKIGRKKDDLD